MNPAGVLRSEWDGEKWVEGEEPPEEKEARAQAAILAKLPEILEQNGSAAVKAAIAAVRGEEEARRG